MYNSVVTENNCFGKPGHHFPASTAEVEHQGGGSGRIDTTRGKGSGKKVERENRECTCNLTVMKGTPRKECNTTKESVGWGLKKKKKREILNFQPTA